MKKFLHLIAALGLLTSANTAAAQNEVVHPSSVSTAIYFDEIPSLKDLPPVDAQYYIDNQGKSVMDGLETEEEEAPDYSFWHDQGPDPVWQKKNGWVENTTRALSLNFDGQPSPYLPSDANGTVGPNHYMQTVNTTYAIWNKAGVQVVPPTAMNTLFAGVPGAQYNSGDPLILYDEQAQKWLAVEFSVDAAPYYMLFAVSQTSDPTGAWWRWSFVMNGFPDYEKVGIWRDGYYMGTNLGGSGPGDDVHVFERSAMITGSPTPQSVAFHNNYRPDGFHTIIPLDADGAEAPVGAPGQFIAFNDDAWGGADEIRVFDCAVNWTTPLSSTFTLAQQLPVAPFDSQFNAWGVGDIPQIGQSQLIDCQPYVFMSRGQYKNFGSTQSMVCVQTVDVDGTNHAGQRWYELIKSSQSDPTWEVRQQGTYAPDQHSRFMGSIAINNLHQIALGYSISSATMTPNMRYCGQSAAQYSLGNGVMDIVESPDLASGTASQPSYRRWGDYSLMTIDPLDNTTFWYTNEYYSSGKKTRVVSFTLGTPALTAEFYGTPTTICSGSSVTFTNIPLGGPTSWTWSFPGGTPSSYVGQTPPAITYAVPGTYDVTLTVGDGITTDIETKTGYINVINAVADFTAAPTSISEGGSVVFTDISSCGPGSWEWTFPGGTPSSFLGQNPPAVTYNAIGSYDVILTVTKSGTANTKVRQNYINVGSSVVYLMANDVVTTCAGNFYDSGGPSGNYTNFEDLVKVFYPGTPGAKVRVQFNSFALESSYDFLSIYDGINTSAALIGTYTGSVSPGTITATNASGALTFHFTSDLSVTPAGWAAAVSCAGLAPPPVADFSASSTTFEVNQIVTFADLSTNTPTSWTWSFNPNRVVYFGGTSASSQNPLVAFTAIGNYTVSLIATNAGGFDTETKTGYIDVDYCSPNSHNGTSFGDYISLVQLGSINNVTGASASPYYTYYSNLSTDLTLGTEYTITVSPGTWSGGGNNISVWIDYNQNGVFDSSEKLGTLEILASPATGTITFTVPANASTGYTRMRVREEYYDNIYYEHNFLPCSYIYYGETEDYNINILPIAYCTPTYITGSVEGDYISLVQLGSINNATGASISPFYTYYNEMSANLDAGSEYTVTLSAGTYISQNYVSVWIDYNYDGVFDATEKLGVVNLPAMPASGSITFTVPGSALPGITRMRVREVYGTPDSDACSNYSYGETEDYNVNINNPTKVLNLTLFLEGLYAGSGTMNQANSDTGPQFGPGIADQITVELHDPGNYSQIDYAAPNSNLNTNGSVSLLIPAGYNGSYYITVKHRNSIETTTANPVSFSGQVLNYSFDQASKAYGNNLLLMIDGTYTIFGGDVNQDGVVDTADMTPVDNDASNFVSGYLPTDVNGDGTLDTADMTTVDNNGASFTGAVTP